jgi:hypothetical protein
MCRYRELTEEGSDRTPWRIRCVTVCGLVVRQTTYANDDDGVVVVFVFVVDDDDDDEDT